MVDEESAESEKPRTKRPRVAVACQRCKTRKQKCDGCHPSCSNCLNYAVACVYVQPENRQASKEQYLRRLEQRVAELESALSKGSYVDSVNGATGDWQILDRQPPPETTSIPVEGGNARRFSHLSTQSSSALPCAALYEPIANEDNESITSVTGILRDLSIEASGGYIGASSNITMGRMIGSLVKRKDSVTSNLQPVCDDQLSPTSLYQLFGGTEAGSNAGVNLMQSPLCDKLLLAYFKHMSLRWPLLRTSFLRGLHERRELLIEPYEAAVLHLVYAIGGRFLETTGQPGAFSSEQHHAAALRELDTILEFNDLRTIEFLLLLSLYSLRAVAPQGPGAWIYVGLAMRLCIDLGLHRRAKTRRSMREHTLPLHTLEMRKRIFWTAYCLDRQVSIILGRPFSISDRDIDAELPLDINEDIEDDAEIAQASSISTIQSSDYWSVKKPTSMSCFIHLCRLRIIESNIQQSIYRVDNFFDISSELEVEQYLEQLELWRATMPRHDQCPTKPHNFDLEVSLNDYDTNVRPFLCCQRIYNSVCESQMVYYYKCMRFLLHPRLLSAPANPRFVEKCAEACGGVCQTYKRLHQRVSVGFSLMALHSVFVAGLTLIYCTWLSPRTVFGMKSSNDLNACSIVLYIITERWPTAKKYRDVFENLKQTVLESIEENGYEERKAVKSLDPGLQTTLATMETREEGGLEVEAMIAEMTGAMPRQDGNTLDDLPRAEAESLSIISAMNASAMDFSNVDLGLGFRSSQDAFSNEWMLELDAGKDIEGYRDVADNAPFLLE